MSMFIFYILHNCNISLLFPNNLLYNSNIYVCGYVENLSNSTTSCRLIISSESSIEIVCTLLQFHEIFGR